MNVTPEEAKRLYCCTNVRIKCHRDSCMAWRWHQKVDTDKVQTNQVTAPPMKAGDTGYCGMCPWQNGYGR